MAEDTTTIYANSQTDIEIAKILKVRATDSTILYVGIFLMESDPVISKTELLTLNEGESEKHLITKGLEFFDSMRKTIRHGEALC